MVSVAGDRNARNTRGRSLSVKTNQPENISKSNRCENFSQMNSAPSHKIEFAQLDVPFKRETNKALLDENWRQRREDQPLTLPKPVPAHLAKSSSNAGFRAAKIKLLLDTSMGINGGHITRIRDPMESPIDAGFILSAPATKEEFGYANEGFESDEEDSDSSGSSRQDPVLGPKHRVYLERIPTTIFEEVEQFTTRNPADDSGTSAHNLMDNAPCRLSFVTSATSGDGATKEANSVHHTFGELQQVKNKGRFRIKDWQEVPSPLSSFFPHLKAPSALDPTSAVGRLAKAYRSERIAVQGVLDDPSVKSVQVNGRLCNGGASRDLQSEILKKEGFGRILEKLCKASKRQPSNKYPGVRSAIESPISPSTAKLTKQEQLIRTETARSFHIPNEKGISGSNRTISERECTLNPKASEFHYGFGEQRRPHTISNIEPPKSGRPTVLGFFNDIENTSPKHVELKSLRQRLANLEWHFAAQAQDRRMKKHELVAPAGFTALMPLGMPHPGWGLMEGDALPGPHIKPALLRDSGIRAPPAAGACRRDVGTASAKLYPSAGISCTHMLPHASGASTTSIRNDFTSTAQSEPQQQFGVVQKPLFGPNGPICIPINSFGPKPVSKPKGPPRPGDPTWAKKQQEYEMYLESKRTVEPDFHRQCRERQARRADRQRYETLRSQFKLPCRNAAVEIKAPPPE